MNIKAWHDGEQNHLILRFADQEHGMDIKTATKIVAELSSALRSFAPCTLETCWLHSPKHEQSCSGVEPDTGDPTVEVCRRFRP